MPCKGFNRAWLDCIWKPREHKIWKSGSTSEFVECAATGTGKPVMLAGSSNSSEWNNDDKWSSQVRKSREMSRTSTGRPASNKLVIDSDTAAESNFYLKSRSFLNRVNDRLRKMLSRSPEDPMQDIDRRSTIWWMDLDQKRSGFLLILTDHKENGTESQNPWWSDSEKANTQFSEPRVHCHAERSKVKEVDNYQYTIAPMGERLKLFSLIYFCQSAQYLRSSLRFVWRIQSLSGETCIGRTIWPIVCANKCDENTHTHLWPMILRRKKIHC